MGFIDSVLREVEIASRSGREIETEPYARRRAQHAAAMEVPAMERIVQISIGRVFTQWEAAHYFRSFGFDSSSWELYNGQQHGRAQDVPAERKAIEAAGYCPF